MKIKNILVTGGAGYIGSHTCVELLNEGYNVVVLDNLCNSSQKSLERVQEITNKKLEFIEGSLEDFLLLGKVFSEFKIDAVIHFAGLKAVGESVHKPIEYYDNNMGSTLTLLKVMEAYGCKNLIFSSSATVYGEPAELPITENCPKGYCTNPYGWSKWMIEQILFDLYRADPSWNITILRYFNPIGAHPSGLIGEDPKGIPNNLLPYVTQVAIGKLPYLNVFGNDYPTKDGTGVRDYIHVVDLAKGHVAALKKAELATELSVYNLGTGNGYSVLDVVKAVEKVSQRKININISPRRDGDIATCFCSAQKAKKELGWSAELDLEDMCRDSWRWQQMNPNGYLD